MTGVGGPTRGAGGMCLVLHPEAVTGMGSPPAAVIATQACSRPPHADWLMARPLGLCVLGAPAW